MSSIKHFNPYLFIALSGTCVTHEGVERVLTY